MATVVDLSGNVPNNALPTDNSLTKVTVFNAGDPTGSITPSFVGQLLFDTTNEIKYKAEGLTNTTWVRTV